MLPWPPEPPHPTEPVMNPLHVVVLAALAAWRKSRPEFAPREEPALFVSTRGTRLSQRSVQARVSHWARRQGIDTNVYPHLFRHSFATHVLESSHDLRGVQEMLGHKTIATTQIYTLVDRTHLRAVHAKFYPRG